MRRSSILLSACLLGVAGVRVAGAQAGWTGAVPISAVTGTLRSINAPEIAADPAGNAVAVWTERDTTLRAHVFTARFDAVTNAWTPPLRLSDGSSTAVLEQRVALDAAGNGLAIWSQTAAGADWTVYSARFTASTGMWSAPQVRSTGSASGVRLSMNAAGDAVAIWSVYGTFAPGPTPGVYVTRFVAASATWTAAERLGPAVQTGVPSLDAQIDAVGNIVAVWIYQSVESRRYSASTGQWSATQLLSAPLAQLQIGQLLPLPKLAVNTAGDVVASWTNGDIVEAARYQVTSATWTPAARVSTGGDDSQRGIIDSAGNIVLAWHHSTAATRTIQAARFEAATSSWTSVVDLAPSGAPISLIFNYGPPAVVVDARDNVLVLASRSTDGTEVRLASAFFGRARGRWTGLFDLTPPGRDARLPNLAIDAVGNAMAVWFEGTGFTSTNQAMRWLAAPGAPRLTSVRASPGSVSIGFAPAETLDPSLAPTTIEYSLDGGASWTTRTPDDMTSPLVLVGLTDRVPQALRLRAVGVAGRGPASPSLRVTSGAGDAPSGLRLAARAGNLVTLAWLPPTAGATPTSYLIEGGLAGQSQVLARIPTAGAATQFSLRVPDGTFFVRVVAVSGSLRLGESASLEFAVTTLGTASAPAALLGSASGSTLALSWQNTWTGAAPTALRLDVVGSITTAVTLPVTESFTFRGVPPGTYTFTVTALDGSTAGAASNGVTLTFPGSCGGVPGTPIAFSASTQGGRVFLDWLPPASGEAVAGYVVTVTGAFVGSIPMTARTLAVPAPPGTYVVQVSSVGPCGTSVPTASQTVVVP